ncbi:unannotated protein [freshwater metagenome]|uniref:Unannotated protein n=1 Tax=freshwater metagenome TaxID=449393 RepID=A0A6J6YTW5_9ZZZZ
MGCSADSDDAAALKVEQPNCRNRAHHGERHARDSGRPMPAPYDDRERSQANNCCTEQRIAGREAFGERPQFSRYRSGLRRESDELGKLAGNDDERHTVEEAKSYRLRQEFGDDAELGEPSGDTDKTHQDGERASECHSAGGVGAGACDGYEGGKHDWCQGGVGADDQDS